MQCLIIKSAAAFYFKHKITLDAGGDDMEYYYLIITLVLIIVIIFASKK